MFMSVNQIYNKHSAKLRTHALSGDAFVCIWVCARIHTYTHAPRACSWWWGVLDTRSQWEKRACPRRLGFKLKGQMSHLKSVQHLFYEWAFTHIITHDIWWTQRYTMIADLCVKWRLTGEEVRLPASPSSALWSIILWASGAKSWCIQHFILTQELTIFTHLHYLLHTHLNV